MARGNRRGGPRSARGSSSGRHAPYATRSTRGRPPRAHETPPATFPPPSPASSSADATHNAVVPTIHSGQRVADLSLEDLVRVVQAVVRENRHPTTTTSSSTPTSSTHQANPPSVTWSIPAASASQPPPVPRPLPGLGSAGKNSVTHGKFTTTIVACSWVTSWRVSFG